MLKLQNMQKHEKTYISTWCESVSLCDLGKLIIKLEWPYSFNSYHERYDAGDFIFRAFNCIPISRVNYA